MDLSWSQPIWLQQVGYLAPNNAHMTIWEYHIIMLEIHQAKPCNSDDSETNLIHRWGIITLLCGHHLQALTKSPSAPRSTCHQAHHSAGMRPMDIRVMGHNHTHIISTKMVIVDQEYSALSQVQHMGFHLQGHVEWLQHHQDTLQWLGRYLSPVLFQHNYPAHLWDPPEASQRDHFSRQQICAEQMLKGLMIRSH